MKIDLTQNEAERLKELINPMFNLVGESDKLLIVQINSLIDKATKDNKEEV